MWRWALRVVAGLTIAHGALSMAISLKIFPQLSADMLGFAQHGFAFLFIALLNLVAWQAPRRSLSLRVAVHAGNVGMLAFYVLWCIIKPEAPNYVAAGLLFALTVLGAIGEWRPPV
jgi:hypothetical protein